MEVTQELKSVSHGLRMRIENGFVRSEDCFSTTEMVIVVFLRLEGTQSVDWERSMTENHNNGLVVLSIENMPPLCHRHH